MPCGVAEGDNIGRSPLRAIGVRRYTKPPGVRGTTFRDKGTIQRAVVGHAMGGYNGRSGCADATPVCEEDVHYRCETRVAAIIPDRRLLR